jgi:hypothetical protein
MGTRAERLAHGQQTNRQDNVPVIGMRVAEKANRHELADRFPDPAGHKRIEGALALIDADDRLLTDQA